MKATEFKTREFESEENSLFTFQGHGGSFCIMLNSKCIHSVKTKSAHDKKLSELINELELTEI